MNKITNFGQQGARIREEADAVPRKKTFFLKIVPQISVCVGCGGRGTSVGDAALAGVV